MKKAICIGIDNYPGTANDLDGCVADANSWKLMLEKAGFEVTGIYNESATKANVLSAIGNLLNQAADVAVITYSGHGTCVIDRNSDEADGYDEALYLYDGPLLDDDLRIALDKAQAGTHLVVICDSCFSGTVTRAVAKKKFGKVRYFQTDKITKSLYPKSRFLEKSEMVEVLLTGCADDEYSYEAYIDGEYRGAFTHFAQKALTEIGSGKNYIEWFTKIREYLPDDRWPQTPQLEGMYGNLERAVLDGEADEPTEPEEPAEPDNPADPPEPEEPLDWQTKYWWVWVFGILAFLGLAYWLG